MDARRAAGGGGRPWSERFGDFARLRDECCHRVRAYLAVEVCVAMRVGEFGVHERE